MRYLELIWPWSQLKVMRLQIEQLERCLKKEISDHDLTKAHKTDLLVEIKAHQTEAAKRNLQARKMAQIIALKGGIL